MTPDFLAGLLIGSFGVYACWLLSLRLAEPPRPRPSLADPVLAALLVLGEELRDD